MWFFYLLVYAALAASREHRGHNDVKLSSESTQEFSSGLEVNNKGAITIRDQKQHRLRHFFKGVKITVSGNVLHPFVLSIHSRNGRRGEQIAV